jgi:hypothetical protein
VINPFAGPAGDATGSINMLNSEISSIAGSSVSVLVNGDINVGKSSIGAAGSGNSGLYTTAGGGIDIFAGGNVNVNESRIMTFRGGNIFTWSDHGSINAGRGSRTAISASPPKIVYDEANDTYSYEFTPPSLGSGYRAVTYDPDGPEGPKEAPTAGDVFLYAPDGDIDAGEAGIAGNRIVLGANAILNAKNISFGSASVGVPVGESTVNLGALTGVSSLTESNKMIEQTSLGTAKDMAKDNEKIDQLLGGWLDVKVISFDVEEEDRSGE